ncbi:MAG: hypothetical protein HKL95_00955 [Phycisphaerae bacterium]|nr:hypothetical protein [Phycisphaerae bacterium]
MTVNLDADFSRATGQKTGAVKGAVKSAAASSSLDVQGRAGELAKVVNIRELHNDARTRNAMQSRLLGAAGFEPA